MSPCRIQVPLSNHPVRKFPATGQSPQIFRRVAQKSVETVFMETFPPRNWMIKPTFHTMWVISIFYMNFTETNPQAHLWRIDICLHSSI